MIATYINNTQFSVSGDHSEGYIYGRRVKIDCGLDGVRYSTIVNSVYSNGLTIISLEDAIVTPNIIEAFYGIINSGENGSLPNHTHIGSAGQGGPLDFINLHDTPTTYSGAIGKYLSVTSSGIAFSELVTPPGVQNFTELLDTPATYSGAGDCLLGRNYTNTEFEWKDTLDFGIITPTILLGELIMPMTSNTEPSGIAAAQSTREAAYAAYKAFDMNDSTWWWSVGTGDGKWLSFDFGTELVVNSYELGKHNMKNWSFQGYNGSSWITLHTTVLPSEASNSYHPLYPYTNTKKIYTFSNNNIYKVYRILINGGQGTGWWDFGIDEAVIHHLQMIRNV